MALVQIPAPQAGGMVELASGTLSGSAVNLTSISGSYRNLQLVIRNFRPANDDTGFQMRINNDSTSNRYRTTTLTTGDSTTFDQNLLFPSGSNDDTIANGLMIINFFDYANSTTWKMGQAQSVLVNATTTTSINFRSTLLFYNQTAAITQLNLFPGFGNFTSGNYILYGVS